MRYSFTGAITEPRQVLQGGYLSWQEPISKHFFQERRIDTDEPDFEDLGIPADANQTPREFIDRVSDRYTHSAIELGRKSAAMASNLAPERLDQATSSQAKSWEELLVRVLGTAEIRKEPSHLAAVRRAPRAPRAA